MSWEELAKELQAEKIALHDQLARDAALWVNADRTVLVRCGEDGTMEVATRSDPGAIWGPPVVVVEEMAR
jgi:hypothetical protein